MSLIEQAAKRLEELRRAGFDAPAGAATQAATPKNDAAESVVERAVAQQKAVRALRPGPHATGLDATAKGEHAATAHPDIATRETPASLGAAPPVDADATAHAAMAGESATVAAHSQKLPIDLARLAAAGIVTPDAPRSQIADEFRVIKRPLIRNMTGRGGVTIRHGNLIMVTSALPGEGKSFTALNLAMSMTMELDYTVLLVDADVARPTVPKLLGWPQTRGLLDLLANENLDVSEVMVRTDVDKLSVLPSGHPHPHATELLASDSMSRLLEQLSERYPDRIVIFDSPPLLVSTESRVLATHMGQVLVVVEAERTQQGAVKQALATIESCPVRLMMLNKTRASSAGSSYGYGYGYSYGYGN